MSAPVGSAGATPAQNNTSSPISSQQESTEKGSLKDGALILGLLALVCAIFGKTLFCGLAISKISRLATWDSAFAQFNSGASGLMDPSLIQLMIPYYMLVAKLWHAGQVPFWNPYNACGVPLLADPQATVFSPLHAFLAIWPSMLCYNRILVAEVGIGAVGAFLLARSLSVSRAGAVLAALAFAFCPFIDWFMELLGIGYMLFPFVFWLFARAAIRPTVSRAAVAGIGSAALILTGHPEAALYGTAFGALLTGSLIWLDAFGTNKRAPERVLLSLRQIVIAAAVAFCFSAPMLLPFVEYLHNSDCYKFSADAAARIPWQALLLNLMQPALGGASLYLGVLPLLSLPFCFVAGHDRRGARVLCALAIVGLASEIFTSRIWPLGLLLKHTPLATLIPNYCQPIPLIMLALMAAFGFDRLVNSDESRYKRNAVILSATASILLLVTFAIRACHAPLDSLVFDSSLTDFHLNVRDWRLTAGLSVAILVLFFGRRFCSPKYRLLPCVAAIAVSFIGQFSVARHALPPMGQFDYPKIAAVTQLSDIRGRYIALGDHLLKPNSNAVYGLGDLRIHNPLFPKGYRDFVSACGAHVDPFNETFAAPLRPLLAIASVSRIASLGPVWSVGTTGILPMRAPAYPCQWQGVQLDASSYAYDSGNRQIVGKLRWRVSAPIGNLNYSLVLLNGKGTTLWFGDAKPLATKPQTAFEQDFGVAIPVLSKADLEPLMVGVQLFDSDKLQFQEPLGGKILQGHVCQLFPVATASGHMAPMPQMSDPAFKLLKELPSNLRIYENKLALPEAYTVQALRTVASQEEALKAIQSPDFAFQAQALLESAQPLPGQTARQAAAVPSDSLVGGVGHRAQAGAEMTTQVGTKPVSETKAVSVTPEQTMPRLAQAAVPVRSLVRNSPVDIEIGTADGPARALVFTDTYYPGWQASVDGNQVPIYRANGFFRGILLPPGQHHVQFKYKPMSFLIGILLAGAMAAVLIAAATAVRLGADARATKSSEEKLATQ